MTALLGAAILFAGIGTLMYGAQPAKRAAATVVVRSSGNALIATGGLIAAVVMFGQMAGITV